MEKQYLTELIKSGDNVTLKENLLENEYLADEITEEGISLLQYSAYCNNLEAVMLLRSLKNQINIFEAICYGDIEKVKILLFKNNTLLNSFSPDGFSPLGLAAYFGHYDIVDFLINQGADINLASSNSYKVTPLHSACAISNIEIAKLLIKNGANVNARQMNGITALHSAAHNGSIGLVKLLVENKADLNAKTENGQTPFDMAEEKSFPEVTSLLQYQD